MRARTLADVRAGNESPVALTSTMYRFAVELSDIDRAVYETLDLRVPCHPSEEQHRLIVRVLARLLLSEEGLEFGRGLSHTDDPALWTRGPHGAIKRWVDVGAPSTERIHRASKAAAATHVVTTKPNDALRREWSKREFHQPEHIEVVHLSDSFVQRLVETLDRRNTWSVVIQDSELMVTVAQETFATNLARTTIDTF